MRKKIGFEIRVYLTGTHLLKKVKFILIMKRWVCFVFSCAHFDYLTK